MKVILVASSILLLADGCPLLCITGKMQSPINLQKQDSVNLSEPVVMLSNYKNEFEAEITNTGHTVKLKISGEIPKENEYLLPAVSFGKSGDETYLTMTDKTKYETGQYYALDHVHFHWASEHTIAGERFPLEAHLVHYRSDVESVNGALEKGYGLLVVGILFGINDKCCNGIFDDITSKIDNISKQVDTPVPLPNKIIIYHLFPEVTTKYYQYNGSLTTPNCNEGVQWIVYETPGCIEKEQLEKLRSIHSKNAKPIHENFRQLRKINGRTIDYVQEQ